MPKSREDLDKEITADDTVGISIDNGLQNQQGQSQGDFTDEETVDNTFLHSTSTNTINCEEQCGGISSTPNIDSSNQGQNDQLSQLNDITVQAESSTTLLGMVQLSTFSHIIY